jgi:hypothetical protein
MNELNQFRSNLRTDQEYVLGFKRSDLEKVDIVPVEGTIAEQVPNIQLSPEAKAELLTLLHYPMASTGDSIQPMNTTFEIRQGSPVKYDSWSRQSVQQMVGSGGTSGSSR